MTAPAHEIPTAIPLENPALGQLADDPKTARSGSMLARLADWGQTGDDRLRAEYERTFSPGQYAGKVKHALVLNKNFDLS